MNADAALSPSLECWPELAWTSSELQARGTWRRELPEDVCDEFLDYLTENPSVTTDDFVWLPRRLSRLAAFGAEVRNNLLRGDGVQCLRGLGKLRLEPDHMRCFYLAIGCALGEPMLQYGRLYPVVDRGASYKTQAVPVSMTNSETCFHTDSSAVNVVPDFVGLLCEEPSNNGGDSLVSNALRVYEVMRREHPDLLAHLQRPLIRDVVTPGRAKTRENLLRNRFPVFASSDRDGGLLFRYMRYWIEVGHEKAGTPLDATVRAAFDRLDALLQRPEHVVTFRLERGDVLWVNNRVLAHNRTAYHDTPGNVRRLQRMWIQAPVAG